MTRFNKKSNLLLRTRIPNLAGGEAFAMDKKLELACVLLTSFLKDQYYRSGDQTVEYIEDLINGVKDKKFVAKAAVYARTKYGMRSVSHLVASEVSKWVKGETWVKEFINKVVYRPDDMTEILACYMYKYGKPVPKALRNGLRIAIQRFDDYQISKYKGEGNDISMIDLVNLIHPQANPVITKLIKGKLKPADTWEVALSQAGQEAEDEADLAEKKSDAWADLIDRKKLGYFAALKNIRNIAAQCPEKLDALLDIITDEKLIKKSLVLPFRFDTAIQQFRNESVDGIRKILVALNKAVEISLNNVPKFNGRTLIAVDCSGSMSGRPIQIASLFASVLYKSNDADMILFGTGGKYYSPNPLDSVLTIRGAINANLGGTNFNSIFDTANKVYDRIIILSDMQAWMATGDWESNIPTKALAAFKRKTNSNPKIYSLDLAGYGSMQFPERDVFCLAGFSEKVFDVMKILEVDRDALIHEIEKVDFIVAPKINNPLLNITNFYTPKDGKTVDVINEKVEAPVKKAKAKPKAKTKAKRK